MTKRCTKCGSEGPFYASKVSPDGLTLRCRECLKAAMKADRLAHPEKIKARKKEYAIKYAAEIKVRDAARYRRRKAVDPDLWRERANESKRRWYHSESETLKREQAIREREAARAALPPVEKPPKTCTKCGSLGPFYADKARGSGLSERCRKCRKAAVKADRLANPDKIRERKKLWHRLNADSLRIKYAAKYQRLRAEKPEMLRDRSRGIQQRRRARMLGVPHTLTEPEWAEIVELFDSRCAYCLRKVARPEQDHVIAISRGGPHSAENIVPACRRCNGRKGERSVFTMLNS